MRKFIVNIARGAIKAGIRMPTLRDVEAFKENAYFVDMMKELRINCLLDVGANNGQWAKKQQQIGFDGKIISFEPIEENYQQLVQQAKGSENWTALNMALGRENKTQKFNVFGNPGEIDNTVFSSFLDVSSDINDNLDFEAKHEQREIQIRRLDEVLPDLISDISEPRIMLKMDTQGFDLEVMEGASGVLDQIIGLHSEVSVTPIYEDMPHYTKSLEYYEGLGFSLMNLFIVNRTKKNTVLEYDCVMAKV